MCSLQIQISCQCHYCFTSPTSTDYIIQTAGIKAMQITYGCGNTPLEKSRYMKFKKQAAKGKIDPDRLPPTEDATAQYSLRVHLQVVVWKHLDISILDPKGRGWELDSNKTQTKNAIWWYRARQPSESNLLQLQGRGETMSNNEMQLHAVCICMWSVLLAL